MTVFKDELLHIFQDPTLRWISAHFILKGYRIVVTKKYKYKFTSDEMMLMLSFY